MNTLTIKKIMHTLAFAICTVITANAGAQKVDFNPNGGALSNGVSIETQTLPTFNGPIREQFQYSNEAMSEVFFTSPPPNREVLVDIFLALQQKGYVKTDKPDVFPHDYVLLHAYQYAIDSSIIDIAQPIAQQLKFLPEYVQTYDPTATILPTAPFAKSRSSCALAAIGCVTTVGSAPAACAIGAESFGVLSFACVGTLVAAGTSCAAVKTECVRSDNRVIYSAGRRGGAPVAGDVKESQTCPADYRVNEATFWSKLFDFNPRYRGLSAIYLYCNDPTATALKFVKNNVWTAANPDSIEAGGGRCGSAPLDMSQGFSVRAGVLVDALGLQCDRAFDTSVPNSVGGLFGGPGGNSSTINCREGDYVVGMNVWTGALRSVKAFELLCAQNAI